MTNNTDPSLPEDYGAELAVDATLDMTLTRDNAPADGKSANVAVATVTNDGQLKRDILIDFQITGGNAVFIDTGVNTVTKKSNPLLMASAQFTDTVGESGTISATVHLRSSLTKQVPYTFNAVAAKSFMLTLSTTRDLARADGIDFDTVTATLVDDKGAPARGQTLVFTLSGTSSASFKATGQPSVSIPTDVKGMASADIIDTANKDASITVFCALVSDATVNDHTQARFTASAAIGKRLLLVPTKDRALADGNDRNRVTATYLGADEKPIPGERLDFSLAPDGVASFVGGQKSTSADTEPDGTASAELVDKANKDDTVAVYCTVASNQNINANTDVIFKSPTTQEGGLELDLNVIKNFAAADGRAANKVQATVHDAKLKGVAHIAVKFTLPATGVARFTNNGTTITQSTNDSGQVSVSLVDGAQRDDTVRVVAALQSDSGITDNKDVTFKMPRPNLSLKLEPVIDNALADGLDIDELTVMVQGADGTAAVSQKVDLSVPSGSIARFLPYKTTTLTVITGNDGTALAQMVDDAGQDDIVISTGVLESDTSVTDTAELRFRAPGFNLQLDVTKDNASADGTDFDTVTATLTDATNRPVAGQTLQFSLPAGGTAQFAGGGTSLSMITDKDGKAEVKITDRATNDTTVPVTCTLAADLSISESVNVHFKAKRVPAIASFVVNAVNAYGINNDGKPCAVEAVITPVPGSAPADYIVRFDSYGLQGLLSNYVRITAPGSSSGTQQQYYALANSDGTNPTHIPAAVHYVSNDTGSVNIQAALLTSDNLITPIAFSSRNAQVFFTGQGTPPPPPPPPGQTLPKLSVTSAPFVPRSTYACYIDITVINAVNLNGTFEFSSNAGLFFSTYKNESNPLYLPAASPLHVLVKTKFMANLTAPFNISYNGTVVWSGTINTTTLAVTGN